MICVKDADGRYVAANDAFVQRTKVRNIRQVIGRRAAELFPADLAASYEAQDRSVLATGRPVRNQLEIITDAAGHPGWYLTTKVIEVDEGGGAEVVAVSVEANVARRGSVHADGLRAVVDLVRRDFAQPLKVERLAEAANMSADQLERIMRNVLATSPKQYILRTRVDNAAFLLVTTDRSIADIATSCGFFDQSQLSRQFTAALGLAPGRYRALVRTPSHE